jgi:hypothetical protein
MMMRLILSVMFTLGLSSFAHAREKWTTEQAQAWAKSTPWLVGCNFTPSTASNELEMWQAETFDLPTIDRELGWAHGLGFTSVRVFLHNLVYTQNSAGFLDRMDQFLAAASKHHILVDFVLFDSCWDPNPKLGKQQEPAAGLHNSRWVQAPGIDLLTHESEWDAQLKPYVTGVIGRFKDDARIAFWETMNEPDNQNGSSYGATEPADKPEFARKLVLKTFEWAREAGATQPLTSGPWRGDWADPDHLSTMEQVQLDESDIISFHNYDGVEKLGHCIENLRRYGRPILCTEYMARPNGSRFDPNLGFMKEQHVGAFNWGFVAGRTNTIYAWSTWKERANVEPTVWFHDILRPDGTPFDQKEVDYIRKVTGAK